ncbi:hypothetical protein VQH23_09005 [Pararoseomonas sp. SCSIO 73927]|uniref:hypothetical protein n=1 Tax=Pararoseomonas sp. SCSIO 73927 TaxID=3114537 RepID=UPI0030D5E25E
MPLRTSLAAALLALAPTAAVPATAPAAEAEAAWSFACPAPGTAATYAPPVTMRHEGTAGGPLLCRVAGQRTPWVLGLAGDEDPSGRALLETLERGFFPARPGAVARRPPRPGGTGNAGATELTFAGYEALEVPAGRFEAARIDFRYQRSADRVQTMRAWIDRATGVLVRMELEEGPNGRRIEAVATTLTRP